MLKVAEIIHWLEQQFPLSLAETWDNVGLLWGSPDTTVRRVLTCLTLTEDVAAEAREWSAELIVTHHPILFKPVQQLTTAESQGRLLLELAGARIAVYSPHTAYDSAARGINQQLAESLGLQQIRPLRPITSDPSVGGGRYGDFEQTITLTELAQRICRLANIPGLQLVGPDNLPVSRLAIACGAAGDFLSDACVVGCQAFLTGEARFHEALRARDAGVGLLLAGHYATERPALETLAQRLEKELPALECRASIKEADPLRWFTTVPD